MNETEQRRVLSQVALGEIPPDTVVTNGVVFNAFTREFLKGRSIWIKDGWIAYVGPDQDPLRDDRTQLIDAQGRVVLPGLIEGHTHATSNRSGLEEFIKHVIPSGVTTVITETIELASVVGKKGVETVVRGLENQPIRFFYTIPPLCGLTAEEEASAPDNGELLAFLKDPRCLGVGEIYWGNLLLRGRQGERVRELASMALELGKRVEGHTAGASGRKLQAYTDLGVSSCHEPITEEEVLDRLRLGYWVMIRQGTIRKELEAVQGIFKRGLDLRRLILVTDGVDPEGFLTDGYLDASLREALRLGAPAGIAYQMVTLNVAEHFGLADRVGSVSPGRMADLVVIPSPDQYAPELILCEGKMIFQNGKSLVAPRKISYPEELFDTVKIDNYRFPPIPVKGRVRGMELVSRLVSQETVINLDDQEQRKGLNLILAIDRVAGGGSFMGFLKGFGLQRGAVGTTMSWDTVDLIVVGCDPSSMKTVIERLKAIGGGAVFAIDREVIAEFPAPLCGVNSSKPMETVREEMRAVEGALRQNGVKWDRPVLTVDTLGTCAIPQLRITHRGYVRLRDRQVLPLEV